MAGDWIKFEHATLDKPEVIAMADMLGTSADDVVGKLLRVWVWFDKQSRFGDAGSVTESALMRFIDHHVGSQGFAACMKKVGWLCADGLPNFDRHNGETAKNRALSKNRMKRKRYANVTQEASPEKRREEKTPIVPTGGFEAFWSAYPSARRIAKSKCLDTWNRGCFESSSSAIVAHVTAMRDTDQWQREAGKFIPSTQTYLNQKRWEDGFPELQPKRLSI